MMLEDYNPTEGRLPAALAALALVLGAIVALLFAGSLMARCSAPSPVPLTTPRPESRAEAVTQATATASQVVKVTITRKPTAQDAPQATKQVRPGGLSLIGTDGGSTAPTDGESITIEVSQAVGVAAGASASVKPDLMVQPVSNPYKFDHARLGVIAATMPGILAADYQLLRLDASPLSRPVLGVDLELGLDAAVNLEAGAVGVTAGKKAFTGAYYWSRWNLSEQGLAAGVGLRF